AWVQATWNVLETSAAPALAEAHDAGLGVIVKEALANGRLTDRGDPPSPLQESAARADTTVDALALAAALAQPWADVVLSGVATVGQLRSNLAALDVAALELPDLGAPPDEYWVSRASLPWT